MLLAIIIFVMLMGLIGVVILFDFLLSTHRYGLVWVLIVIVVAASSLTVGFASS